MSFTWNKLVDGESIISAEPINDIAQEVIDIGSKVEENSDIINDIAQEVIDIGSKVEENAQIYLGDDEPNNNQDLWINLKSANMEVLPTIYKNYAQNISWTQDEQWVATSGNISAKSGFSRTNNYIEVTPNSKIRIRNLVSSYNTITLGINTSFGCFYTSDGVRTKGFIYTSNYILNSTDDFSCVDLTVPDKSYYLNLNALGYTNDEDLSEIIVVNVFDNYETGELETEQSAEIVANATSAHIEYKNNKGEYVPISLSKAGTFSKQYQYQYKDSNGSKSIVNTLPFVLYEPTNISADEKYPLILVLHSSLVKAISSLGTSENLDNMVSSMIYEDIPKYFYNGIFGDIPAYVVMPQTDSSSNGWARRGEEIKNLISACTQKYKIDNDKIGIIGYSSGGTGAWELATDYPDIFKRIVPIAGGLDGVTNSVIPYDPINGEDITDFTSDSRIQNTISVLQENNTKVLAIVGSNDAEVSPDVSVKICNSVDTAECLKQNEYSHTAIISYCETISYYILKFLVDD